jgi:hypothetical protein
MPPSVIRTEMAKHWYLYFGFTLGPLGKGRPPAPAALQLGGGNGTLTKPRLISADSFTFTMSFSANVGDHNVLTNWGPCVKDTSAGDGFGVPGPLDCGDSSVPANVPSIG